MDNKNKSYFVKLILAIIAFVIFLIVLGLIAQMVKNKRAVNPQPQILVSPEPTATPVVKDETADVSSKALATEDWKTYRNEEYGFEFMYPKIGSGLYVSAKKISDIEDMPLGFTKKILLKTGRR